MLNRIDLSGTWRLLLDEKKEGLKRPFTDEIMLPGTTSHAKKGRKNEKAETGCLTDEYLFEGYAWYEREFEVTPQAAGDVYYLYLERTRKTRVWVDGTEVGSHDSLCTPHIYDITGYVSTGKHTITILVDNTDYPTRGGHMTSPDTQTNWNGITGRMEIQVYAGEHIQDVQLYPNIHAKSVRIRTALHGTDKARLAVRAESYNSRVLHKVGQREFFIGENDCVDYHMGDDALLWSEFEPNLYKLFLELYVGGKLADRREMSFGLREFKADRNKFSINGTKTFLRGKHEGMIFPLTGFAPTSVQEWIRVMQIAKNYGINHYRFHTCCPPEAAFEAADILGIYMEPELPFWGTVTDEDNPGHNGTEQEYLIREGYEILKHYGNHPSFVMMSLGNELWGSDRKLNEILKKYKEYDNRRLYTQGSNNFQFVPRILENEDFFCGVRFSKHRLIRGSYAMCDAPLGHVQTDKPGTMKDYDLMIRPSIIEGNTGEDCCGTREIQYGTGVKKVEVSGGEYNLIPEIPVVSHEIGQYAMYPNFKEIGKYTGSLKAKNFEIFRNRLEARGLAGLADKFFYCSGKLAAECYREELEAAFRSKELAGFQLLDLQDFSGQGTALVGMLDAFMDSKGLISVDEWRSFCSDAVLLARFEKYNYESGEIFTAGIELSYYRDTWPDRFELACSLRDGDVVYYQGENTVIPGGRHNHFKLYEINTVIPETDRMKKLTLDLKIKDTDIFKTYDIWIYPAEIKYRLEDVCICGSLTEEVISLLAEGEWVVMFPDLSRLKNSLQGFYCTDFWCYPMFRSISESMNKEVPVGTLGLMIDSKHPVFGDFECEEYSTYPWWSIVTNSRAMILDNAPKDLRVMVRTIDNFERNHNLGMMFECRVLDGKLLVCSFDYEKAAGCPEGRMLLKSIANYVSSDRFNPDCIVDVDFIRNLISDN